jgi:hypothetical protein
MEAIRAVQIDLASQKESISEILRFFDHAKKYNYNTVVMYLEDRIKTKTYPYISDEESYSEDEIRGIVKFASDIGLDIIPVVSNFSHTGRFLQHGELQHIAELRGNIKGRFNEAGSAAYVTSCPSLPEAQKFFDSYMKEVAALFPSKYFLAGLDEAFDIGCCDICRKEVESYGGIGRLFLNHVIRTNNLLKSLGKEMIMFDDMFWFCPEILSSVPKDIIMCTWNYDYVNRLPRCQFGNSAKKDIFGLYDKLGIRYICAVWNNFINNIDSYTRYAKDRSPIGYLNTTWQMTAEQYLFTYPLIAYTGLLWSGDESTQTERMKRVIAEITGERDGVKISALAMAASKAYLVRVPMYHLHGAIVRRNDNFDDEYKEVSYTYEILKDMEFTSDVAEELRYRTQRAKLLYEVSLASEEIFDMKTGMRRCDIDKIIKKLDGIKASFEKQYEKQAALWQKYRPGILPTRLENERKYDIEAVEKLINSARSAAFGERGVLDMTLLLPDKSTLSRIEITVKYDDGEEVLKKGIYKPLATSCYYITDKGPYLYTVSFEIDGKRRVEGCRIKVSGFGATDVAHVCAWSDGVAYTPREVTETVGRVENPEHMLVNDTRHASIGNPDMLLAMANPSLADEVSYADIRFCAEI